MPQRHQGNTIKHLFEKRCGGHVARTAEVDYSSLVSTETGLGVHRRWHPLTLSAVVVTFRAINSGSHKFALWERFSCKRCLRKGDDVASDKTCWRRSNSRDDTSRLRLSSMSAVSVVCCSTAAGVLQRQSIPNNRNPSQEWLAAECAKPPQQTTFSRPTNALVRLEVFPMSVCKCQLNDWTCVVETHPQQTRGRTSSCASLLICLRGSR